MAEALRSRIHAPDPVLDWLLEPAEATVARARLRSELRELSARPDIPPEALSAARLHLAGLPRMRMRLSDIPRELPRLAAALASERARRERASA